MSEVRFCVRTMSEKSPGASHKSSDKVAARKRLPRRDAAIAAIVTASRSRRAAASLGPWIRDLPSDGRQEAVSELGHV